MATNPFLGNIVSLAEATGMNSSSCFGGAVLVIFDGVQPTNCGVTALTQLSTASPPTWNSGTNTTNILAVFNLPAAGSNTVTNFTTSNGGATITFGALTAVAPAYKTGTATWFRILNGATVNGASNQITVKGNEIMDGSVGTASADLILNSVSISSGATVSISSFVLTVVD
jgi:hypothetical protein